MGTPVTASGGGDLAGFRSYLRLLVRDTLRGRIRRRVDGSDIVQDVLVAALRKWAELRGRTRGEIASWLRSIARHTVSNTVRGHHRGVRNIDKELYIDEARNDSWWPIEGIAAQVRTPSGEAQRNETRLRLAESLARLPEPERKAIVLHAVQGLPLSEIARQLGRTPKEVAGLIQRGTRTLRRELQPLR